jgi:hypothetical protein
MTSTWAHYTAAVEHPCPPVVSSAKGDNIDPPRCRADGVVLGVFALLRALHAGQDVVAGIVLSRARLVAKGSSVDQLLVGDPPSYLA